MKLGLSSQTYPWAIGLPGHTPAVQLDEQGLLDRVGAAGLGLLQIGDNPGAGITGCFATAQPTGEIPPLPKRNPGIVDAKCRWCGGGSDSRSATG